MKKPVDELYTINQNRSICYEKNKSTLLKFVNTNTLLTFNDGIEYLVFKSKSSKFNSDIILIPNSEMLDVSKIIHISEKNFKRIKINEYYFFKRIIEQTYSFNVGQYYNFFQFLDLYVICDILLSYQCKNYNQIPQLLKNMSNEFLNKCLEFLNCKQSKERIFNRINNGYLNNKGLCYYTDNLLIFRFNEKPFIIKNVKSIFKTINDFELEVDDLIKIIEFFNEETIPKIINCKIYSYRLSGDLEMCKCIILKFKECETEFKFIKNIYINEVKLCDESMLELAKNQILKQISKFEEDILYTKRCIENRYKFIEKLI